MSFALSSIRQDLPKEKILDIILRMTADVAELGRAYYRDDQDGINRNVDQLTKNIDMLQNPDCPVE